MGVARKKRQVKNDIKVFERMELLFIEIGKTVGVRLYLGGKSEILFWDYV